MNSSLNLCLTLYVCFCVFFVAFMFSTNLFVVSVAVTIVHYHFAAGYTLPPVRLCRQLHFAAGYTLPQNTRKRLNKFNSKVNTSTNHLNFYKFSLLYCRRHRKSFFSLPPPSHILLCDVTIGVTIFNSKWVDKLKLCEKRRTVGRPL